MRSIPQKCKVDGCECKGYTDKNGKVCFVKGYCVKHYKRLYRGNKIDSYRDKRRAIIEGDIAKIPLGENAKNGYAIVDADMAWIEGYHWNKSGKYVARDVFSNGYKHKMLLHRFILKLSKEDKTLCDHINRNPLDNRKSNLRKADSSQNNMNRGTRSNNTSGYKGVSYDVSRNKWQSMIACRGERYHIGRFPTKEEAARAYDEKAKELFGEFAYLNFPE